MTSGGGVGPTGSPSMGCGGSSGVRRLLGKVVLRLLVCQSPLGEKRGDEGARVGTPTGLGPRTWRERAGSGEGGWWVGRTT